MNRCLILTFLMSVAGLKADEGFTRTVQPFLKTYCVTCHGPDKQKGKIRLDQLTASPCDRKEAELWSKMLEAMEGKKVTSKLIVLEGAGHGFRGEQGKQASEAMVAWFVEHLARK